MHTWYSWKKISSVNYYAIRRNLKSEEMVQEWPIQRKGKMLQEWPIQRDGKMVKSPNLLSQHLLH